ncbi:hypothetical protein SAMN05444487_12223 [Marininema mesophilum]|uniref:Uncharacterized protein n=1 Tax=Marininema mesophilum TaxID=1048340 RepID=A0A1H3CG41_9BACL|nr:hypothetical protein SAMN05444487_12223 [Marininema mesophilum]
MQTDPTTASKHMKARHKNKQPELGNYRSQVVYF